MEKESNNHCRSIKCTKKGGDDICLCPLDGVINVISRKWALLIICTIGNSEKIRFNEITENLGNISPKTLTDRLRELEEFGLIEREAFAEIPPRVEYSLTEDGTEVRDAMIPLMKWTFKKDAQKKI